MLLTPLHVEGKKEKEIFRPFDATYPEISRVDSLIHKWLKSSPLNNDVEVVLEKRSVNGDGNGVGAVWSAWVTIQIPKKHHTDYKKVKKLFEVKSIIPNQQIVLQISVDNNETKLNCLQEWFRPKANIAPSYLMFSAVEKSKTSTEVTAHLSATVPSMCQLCPKQLVCCPCLWPHIIVVTVFAVICCPCCRMCTKSLTERDLTNQCDQGLSAIKYACENGPPTQVMSDHNGSALIGASPPSYGAVMAAPQNYSNVAAGPYVPPKLANVVGDSAACNKCGQPLNNTDDAFCGKCGARQ